MLRNFKPYCELNECYEVKEIAFSILRTIVSSVFSK